MWNLDEPTRAWVYRVAMLALPLLVFYGILAEAAAPLWVALLGGALVPGLAARNTTTGDH